MVTEQGIADDKILTSGNTWYTKKTMGYDSGQREAFPRPSQEDVDSLREFIEKILKKRGPDGQAAGRF